MCTGHLSNIRQIKGQSIHANMFQDKMSFNIRFQSSHSDEIFPNSAIRIATVISPRKLFAYLLTRRSATIPRRYSNRRWSQTNLYIKASLRDMERYRRGACCYLTYFYSSVKRGCYLPYSSQAES